MDIKKSVPKTKKDFAYLENLGQKIIADVEPETVSGDWTQDDINLFISQFNGSQQDEDPLIDMNKLDPNFITRDDIAKKYEGFSPEILDILYECENKKLEDARLPPLRVKNQSIKLTDNLSNIVYIDDDEPETSTKTSGPNISHAKTSEKEKKEEEEDWEGDIAV
jgi:hypothetical protein